MYNSLIAQLPAPRKKVKMHYVKTPFGNGHRLPLVTGNAPVTDQVLQISQ
jgi:hypothetical protein